MTRRHVLDVTDFTASEIVSILDLAERPIESLGRPLDGAGAALIFEKPSNRTRHSMEMAVAQLGGHPVYTRGEEVGFDTREPVEDIGKIMAGYHQVIAARVFDHATLDRLVAAVDSLDGASTIVVNMLSDRSHPLQAFADALTMRQRLGELESKTVAYIGDYNNVARSLAEISLLLGMKVRISCPPAFAADEAELERLSLIGSGDVLQTARPHDAVAGAHAVHTDTWVSMGQEAEKEVRRRMFEGFAVDAAMMSLAADDAVFMHCLPAYRGFEVTADVIDGPQSVVFQQGHNRMHAARAVLAFARRNGERA
ncbi:ornithine carbamoyltransferase [Ilumatobacter coccineus]|uniref:Ornithine carbamoyltransferase n=1 Tax=Ilumatobacter coccineus (strain NBRC 103263 / KCTC 29153 / YM16-304) TaxID=1313172 RepID=A0A6C7EEJ3_ILUCY|nr:ornithine carbamoyltransferase [Ilumatobacter coccineus]BAN02396.1 ornithine carbamoyltransferase [Ilumatobacter coccineus YM16-304]